MTKFARTTVREVTTPPLHWQPWRNLLEPTIRGVVAHPPRKDEQ